MKKFFLLVVIVLLLITFSDTDMLRPYRDQLYALIQDNVPSAGDNKDAALRKIQKQLLTLSEQWGEEQRAFLEKASSSIENIKKFHRNYCINNDFNPILFGDPLKQSCVVIENNYDNLLKP
ncbi:hypothetical protein [Rheinheimera metallidurans]|uniref:hypothetical protein n=1 Tax=Rheinheimera metallidurans TaxID=2925781 RepID=UPI00300337A4